jgi:voltage-gated potassium channel
MSPSRRILWAGVILATIIVAGVVGYRTIEGWPWFDSLYMTIITITTVGFSEVHPLSTGGRIFTIFLTLGGIGGAFYALVGIVEYVIEGQFGVTLGRRRMMTRISKLKDHFILCGYGKVGEETANTFKEEGVPFIVVDNRPDCIARAEKAGHIFMQGDATTDEVLKEAGIERARGLVAAVGSDADNTYITLTARGLNPSLFISARASEIETEGKLKRAGANRVVSPNSIGGRRLAMLTLRPAVVDFLDVVTSPLWPQIEMENVAVDDQSSLNGQTVKEIRQCSRAMVIAVTKKNGQLLPNPAEDERISAGDSIIIMGAREQLTSVEAVCRGELSG